MEKFGGLIVTVLGAMAGAAVAVCIVILMKWITGAL